ncbi:MAG TPA: ATP-binding cassette domain-containing protein, partial [Anaerolineales bacterium]|nr:ATP-binding cassette domain-containing protein [Anaerolineales bacterium]
DAENSTPNPNVELSSIELSNVSFTYPDEKFPALENINLTIKAGQYIAIVGSSGTGKSTIANLLFRFWEYESGEISLGGESLKSLNQDEIRKRCALVSQNSYFFNTSIRENLRVARPKVTPEKMEEAARSAQIHEFIAGLPKGYDTFIGEHGLRLSGGERQRLAIARALLKDAPILILDEPTANLDTVTEKQVLDVLFKIMQDRASLLITHRLVGLESVDEVLVMSNGQIVERGGHDKLINNQGIYQHLWNLQNRILVDE